jgi:hypothetical protein
MRLLILALLGLLDLVASSSTVGVVPTSELTDTERYDQVHVWDAKCKERSATERNITYFQVS